MIRNFLSLGFIFISITSFSQNYATVYSDKEALYKNDNWGSQHAEERLCGLSGYLGMDIDSSKTIGAHIIHYHFNTLRRLPESLADCGSSYFYKKVPIWTGSKTIIKNNGENIFLTNNGDSIRIKTNANINDTWHFFDFINGDYFEAEVTGLSMGTVLTVLDNIKVITLTLKDNTGNPVTHDFNGKEILLSENYGLVKAYDFSRFPLDTSAFTLQGVSSPDLGIQNITAREIFDYNVGDEFHIDDASSYVPYNGRFTKERRIVLSKIISLNQDTLTYQIERILITHTYNWQDDSHDSSSVKDTVTEKVIVSKLSSLGFIPSKIKVPETDNFSTIYCLNNSSYNFNNRLVKSEGFILHSSNDPCFEPVITSGMDTYEYFVEGLGAYYEGDNFPNQYHRRLIYYKKGSETWGTPDVLLSLNQKNKSEITSAASPNPFNDFTILKIDNPSKQTYKLTLMDIYGKVIREYSFNEDQLMIRNDGNLKGLYMYKLHNDKNEAGTGKLIIY